MLTSAQIDIIKATAPVVGAHARDITECFYPLMFERYPTVAELFNQTHQQKGTQRQALANALVAYATHIDKLEALGDAVGLIAHKHVSLNILPEHYPIVGECLMEAIGQILGDAVTPEIADAWGAAYQQLADILIGVEEQLYSTHAQRRGGWRGERQFVIERIEPESEVISSFYLMPVEGERVIDFEPGQYIGLIVNVDGKSVRRNYSLSDAPGKPGLRISVKKELDGEVSGFLHNQAEIGDQVTVIAPAGDFTLPAQPERPLVFVTGGVGITPAISMLNAYISNATQPVIFIHAAVNSRYHAFKSHLENLAAQHPLLTNFVIYERPKVEDRPDAEGYITREILADLLPQDKNVDLYFLGPLTFMNTVNSLCDELGLDASQKHYEFFGPAEALQSQASATTEPAEA